MKTVSKTYRISESVVSFIEKKAKDLDLSQGDALQKVIEEYTNYVRDKQFTEDVIAMSKDKEYMKEQVALAEANWL